MVTNELHKHLVNTIPNINVTQKRILDHLKFYDNLVTRDTFLADPSSRALDVAVSGFNKKLKKQNLRLKAVRGIGYKMMSLT